MPWRLSILNWSSIGILSRKTWCSTTRDISAWPISASPESSHQTTQVKPVVLLGTWRLRSCVARITGWLLTILQWASSLMSVWWERDLTKVARGRISGTRYFSAKSRSRSRTYLPGGTRGRLTSSISASRGKPWIALATITAQLSSRITLGLMTLAGKRLQTGPCNHNTFQTLTLTTLMRTMWIIKSGKTPKLSRKVKLSFAETAFSNYLKATITISSM